METKHKVSPRLAHLAIEFSVYSPSVNWFRSHLQFGNMLYMSEMILPISDQLYNGHNTQPGEKKDPKSLNSDTIFC